MTIMTLLWTGQLAPLDQLALLPRSFVRVPRCHGQQSKRAGDFWTRTTIATLVVFLVVVLGLFTSIRAQRD